MTHLALRKSEVLKKKNPEVLSVHIRDSAVIQKLHLKCPVMPLRGLFISDV